MRLNFKLVLRWGSALITTFVLAYFIMYIYSARLFIAGLSSNEGIWKAFYLVATQKARFSLEEGYSLSVAFDMLLDYFPRTLLLVETAFIIAVAAGIALGMLFGYKGGRGRRTLQVFALTIPVSLPDVLIILSLQMLMFYLKSAGLPNIPSGGYRHLTSVILPAVSLSIIPACYIAKITYSMAVEAYEEKFILTAKAKGCSDGRVHLIHIWRKIRLGVIDSLYGVIPVIISNLLLVEMLFYYPGMANSLFKSLDRADINVFMVMAVGITCTYLITAAGIYVVKRLVINGWGGRSL